MRITRVLAACFIAAQVLGMSLPEFDFRLLNQEITTKEYLKIDGEEQVSDEDIRIEFADSFYVNENGTVYLLDSYARKIHISSKVCDTFIDLSMCGLPCDFVLHRGNLYVYDEMKNEIYIRDYNLNKEIIIPLNHLKDTYFKRFVIELDKVFFDTYNDVRYIINPDTLTVEEYCSYEDNIQPVKELELAEFFCKDCDGNKYSIQTDILYKGALTGSIVIVKEDTYGSYSYYVFPDEVKDVPVRFLQVTGNNVYVMLTYKDRVAIEKIEFSDKLILPKYKYNGAYGKGSKFGTVGVSSEEALMRAEEMNAYSWTLTSDNTKISTNTSLPREVEFLSTSEVSEVVGIPYCWGGSSSIYKDFDNQINKGYLAGNFTTSGSYKAKTAGLDCSGYVSIAYDLSSKQGTYGLVDYAKRVKDLDDLRPADMLIAPGNHVVLFAEQIDDGAFLVCECCGRNGKTVKRIRTLNWFVTVGQYQAMTPWK